MYEPFHGGVQTYVMEISERLSCRGYDVEVLTTDPTGGLKDNEVIRGVPIRRFRSWAPWESFYFSEDLRKYLARNSDKYDLIHAHNYHAMPALYATTAKKNSKLVFNPHFHGTGHTFVLRLLHVPYRMVSKKMFRKCELTVCVSLFEKNLIAKSFKLPDERIIIVPNGVHGQMETARPDSQGLVLYLGRLEKYKRVDCLLRALKHLSEDVHLEIVGKGPDKNRIKNLVVRLELTGRVTFLEDIPQNELWRKYASASVFVTLSRYEAYGLAVAEALAAGTPCVVANTSALTEWIDGRNCLGVDDPSNAQLVATMISSAMKSRVTDVKIASWDEVAERMIEVYETVCNV